MDQEILYKEMIPQTERWRLALEMDGGLIEVALLPLMSGFPLIHRTIKLNPELQSTDKAVQEAVYANPLLLNDFARIDVLLDTRDFCIVPNITARTVVASELLTTAGVDVAGKNIIICEASPIYSIVFAVDAMLAGFIRRTFFNVRISHILAPIIANPPVNNALFAAVAPKKVLLFANYNNKVLYANALRCDSPEDATYYINAVSHNLPVNNLPIILAGNSPETLMVEKYLSQYAVTPKSHEVSPVVMQYGNDALTLPPPLTALLTCEL